jgi:multiple sugar transport system ATP-binding protein
VGPSGCGKSTTLNLIAGLEEPTEGNIHIGARDVTALSPGERDVAMVFQSYALYPHLTVRQNLGFPLKVAGQDRQAIAGRVEETAKLLGLEALLERKPAELSGGQRQRVALGRALVRRPQAFLFDEPLSNLDAALRAQVRGELKKLHEQLGATFIYVTHDQAEAMTLSDRVAVMNQGVLQQVGAPRELYTRPANLFVGQFFGSPQMNVVEPEVLGLNAPGHLAGVRAEDLEVGVGSGPQNAIACTVFLVEPMGAETWVTVQVRGSRVIARGAGDFAAPSGAAAWLRVDPGRVHWFEKDSLRRVEG